MLKVRNITMTFGGVVALCLDRFDVGANELRVIIGPNGAGKSTLMDVLCGKSVPAQGSATFNGEELIGRTEIEINHMGIGRKFQKPSVFEGLSVLDNMIMGLKGNRGVFASMFFRMTPSQRAKIYETAELVNLIDEMDTLAGSLSHGQKQWLEIAIVLLQDPQLLLIDEPAAGMSDAETAKTGALLLELSKNHSVIVIEHDMHFVEQIAKDKVTVLVRGEILTEGSFQEVKNNKEVIDCYLGAPDSAQVLNAK
ncbi:MAG: urea ABC transporter ATP-binding protein UrtD [Rikenellaceae bacterium]